MVRVVVAGGGYAGLQAVLRLTSECTTRCTVTLIDRNRDHQLITRLPQVVGGSVSSTLARIPYARLLPDGIEYVHSDVTALYPERLAVETRSGLITGEYLVFTLGSSPNFLGIPGAQERAFPVRAVSEAVALRQRLQELLTQRDPLRIVIVGAGYTGTEVAGELVAWSRRRSGAGRSAFSVTIIAPEERLLSEADPRLGAVAERILRRKGVQFRLRHGVQAVESDRVLTESGEACMADVVIWATRARAAVPRLPGVEAIAADARLAVDPYLRPAGYDRVYIAGDMSAAYDFRHDRIVPASAQMAVEQGNLIGSNVAAAVLGREHREFRPRMLGEALTLGGGDAVAEVGGIILTGRPASVVKRAALVRYLYRLGGSPLVRDYA